MGRCASRQHCERDKLFNEVCQLKAENERLRAEIARLEEKRAIVRRNFELRERERDEARDKYQRKSRSLDLCEANYERLEAENERLRTLLAAAKPYIKRAGERAEALHDNPGTEYYMDSVQYEIMTDTRQLLVNIDAAIDAAMREGES